jgi:ORF6N domain
VKQTASSGKGLALVKRVEGTVLSVRGHNVMLDMDLAALYHVDVKVLNQAVKRNRGRFPEDFMFRLTGREARTLRSQIVTSKIGRGGRRTAPYAFTEQGVAMLSSVLRSPRAVRANIAIMRAFVRLRQVLASHSHLARKLEELEEKYDTQFTVVFEAIRELMTPRSPARRRIGFAAR